MHLQLLSKCDESLRTAPTRAPSVSVLLVLCMMSSGCLNHTSKPSDEDAFVSYLQSVTSLAKQLKLKFDDKSNGAAISGFVQPRALNSDDRIRALLEEVISYQEAVRAIPTDSRKRLYQLHDELVETTRAECEQLKNLHTKKPKLLAKDWDRCCQAISSVNAPDT